MSLQTSGAIKMSDMNTLFGAPNGTSMSSYLYRGGNYSAYYDPSNVLIPASGPISFSMMYGARKSYFYLNSTAVNVLGGYNMAPWGYSPPGGDTTAQWIWNSAGAAAGTPIGPWIHFYKLFTATSTFTATLYVSDDNAGYVFLNGKLMSTADFGGGWGGTGSSCTFTVNQGTNLLDIYSYNLGGPGGVIAAMYNGSSLVLHTDSTWTAYQTSINNTTCNVIFSCRRINPFYAGAILTIRRSSDGATSDFYTDFMQSFLTTAVNGGGSSLATWLNGATGYVYRWYDQSGNGNHAVNSSNNTTQPNMALVNGRWVIQFQNANATLLTITTGIQPNTIFCHYYNTNNSYATILSTLYDYEQRFGGGNGVTVLGDTNGGDWYYSGTMNGGTNYSYNNGVSSTTVLLNAWNYLTLSLTTPQWITGQTSGFSSSFSRIGYDGASYLRSINGYMTELICHNTPMGTTDITNFYQNRFF
jgi:hypothetical protein